MTAGHVDPPPPAGGGAVEGADPNAAALDRVERFLAARGVASEEIRRAEADGVLDLLVADRALVSGRRCYTVDDLARLTGTAPDTIRRLWRALGFSDAPAGEPVFADLDLEAILILQALVYQGVADIDSAFSLARVIGSSMARIAEAEV